VAEKLVALCTERFFRKWAARTRILRRASKSPPPAGAQSDPDNLAALAQRRLALPTGGFDVDDEDVV
jgi:hypothetical protein